MVLALYSVGVNLHGGALLHGLVVLGGDDGVDDPRQGELVQLVRVHVQSGKLHLWVRYGENVWQSGKQNGSVKISFYSVAIDIKNIGNKLFGTTL